MALWQWSKTATANTTSDPTMNWSEGVAPSIVDDNVRALMARASEYRDDISGSLTTGGSSTAYTLTTNQGLSTPTPPTNQLIAFVPNSTNGAGVTLSADGGSAYPIQTVPGQGVGAGVLVAGSPYTAFFTGTAWLLRNFYGNPFTVPIGGLIEYTGSTPPNSSFVLPFGQAISRTTYSTYFALVGTTYGPGDGSTTFNIIDKRGRISAGQDNMGGSAANRITTAGAGIDGTTIGAAGGAQNVVLATANLPPYTPAGTISVPSLTMHTRALPDTGTISAAVRVGQGIGGDFGDLGTIGAQTFTGTAQGGTSTAVNKMPPTIIVTQLLRII